MKRSIKAVIFLALMGLLSARAIKASEIHWQSNLETAQTVSAQTGRLMMVESVTSWCPYCKKYDTEIYPAEKVKQAVQPFVSVKIDAEKEGKAFAKQYRVQGYPTFLFLDSKGNIIRRFAGKSTVVRFSTLLEEVVSDYREFPNLQARVKNNPHDVDAALKLLVATVRREHPDDAARVITAIGAQRPASALGRQYNMLAGAFAEQERNDEAINWYRKTLDNSTDVLALVAAHNGLATIYAGLNDYPAMKQQLQSIIDLPTAPATDKERAAARLRKLEVNGA